MQINCGINVDTIDTALITPETGLAYLGTIEEPHRLIFRLPITVQSGQHATIKVTKQGYHDTYAGVILPPAGWSVEGPAIIMAPTVEALHIDEDRFLLPSGLEWTWCGHIDFMAFKRSLDGQDLSALVRPKYAVGSRVISTLMMAHYIEHFDPRAYGERFFAHIKPVARALAQEGFYWHPQCLADAQVIMPNPSDQIAFVNRCAREFAGEPNILPGLGNEYPKNGFDPSNFVKPQGNLWSNGSTTGDAGPHAPSWDWKEWHGRRDWPKVLFSSDDMWYVKEGLEGDHQYEHRRPCVHTEPIGFWDRDVPGRRSSDPNLARVIGGTSVYFGRGANFMSEEGLRCQPWSQRTTECAIQFYRGLNQS